MKTEPGRLNPDWLKAYLEYSDFTEAPDIFHFWTGVSTIAGALRNKTWIPMRAFKWIPNFYIVFVAPPGITQKSTTMDLGHNMLRKIEGINFGPDKVTMASLIEYMGKITQPVDMPDGEIFPISAITLSSGEFGTLLNPKDDEMVNLLVDLWDGKDRAFQKATKSSGSDNVQNPYINLIGCCTPSWIEQNFTDYLIGGGFASRTVFVYADKKRRRVAFPDELFSARNAELEKSLVEDLRRISEITGPYELSEEARVVGREWYDRYCDTLESRNANDPITNQIARLQTHALKLSIVFAAAQRDSRIILAEDIDKGFKVTNSIVESNAKIFSKGTSQESRKANKVVDLVLAKKKIPVATAFRELFSQMSVNDFNLAVQAGVQAGLLKRTSSNGTTFLEAGNAKIINATTG